MERKGRKKKVGREKAGVQRLHPQRLHPLLWRRGCRACLHSAMCSGAFAGEEGGNPPWLSSPWTTLPPAGREQPSVTLQAATEEGRGAGAVCCAPKRSGWGGRMASAPRRASQAPLSSSASGSTKVGMGEKKFLQGRIPHLQQARGFHL